MNLHRGDSSVRWNRITSLMQLAAWLHHRYHPQIFYTIFNLACDSHGRTQTSIYEDLPVWDRDKSGPFLNHQLSASGQGGFRTTFTPAWRHIYRDIYNKEFRPPRLSSESSKVEWKAANSNDLLLYPTKCPVRELRNPTRTPGLAVRCNLSSL